MRKINWIAVLLSAMLLLCLAGCGGSNDSRESPSPRPSPSPGPNPNPNPEPGPPITGPQIVQLTGIDGGLRILFTRNAHWGGEDGIPAKYDLRYGTSDNFDSATILGPDYLDVSGLLVSGEITGLTNGVTYYVWVNAVYKDIGSSDYHMETGMPVPRPQSPEAMYALPGDTMIDLVWAPVDYAFSYEVAISTGTNPNAGNVVRRTTTEPRFMITVRNLDGDPLLNGTTYNIWVRSSNTSGQSGYPDQPQITATPVAAAAAPATPGALTVEPGNKRLKVTWDAVRWATSYELYYNTSNNAASAARVSSDVAPASGKVSATIANLINGTQYYVWVKAGNYQQGSSNFSPAGTGAPQDIAVPVNFNDYGFQLGEATGEFIFAELRPFSPFARGNSQGPWDRLNRGKETHLGNLFTDGVMWYLNDRYPEENVDFVFLNSGYIDNVIRQGSISVSTIAGSLYTGGSDLPASSEAKIALLSMKGSDIKLLFDDAADALRTGVGTGGTGVWAIVSKEVNYTVSYPFVDSDVMSVPNPPGLPASEAEPYYHGVIKPGTLKFNGADFDDNKIYRIATTDHQADGLQYLRLLQAGSNRKDLLDFYWRAVAEYIYDAGSVTPAIDGRIRIEGGAPGGSLGVPEGYNQYCPTGSAYDEAAGCIF